MNKLEILKKMRKYTGYLEGFFLIVGCILGLAVKKGIPAAIAFTCYSLFLTGNFIFDSYLYYIGLNLEKSRKKAIVVSIVFEILFLMLMYIQFIISLFFNPSYIYMIINSILIIVFSFCSMFFAELVDDKHNKVTKIFICTFYTIFIIIICAIKL